MRTSEQKAQTVAVSIIIKYFSYRSEYPTPHHKGNKEYKHTPHEKPLLKVRAIVRSASNRKRRGRRNSALSGTCVLCYACPLF